MKEYKNDMMEEEYQIPEENGEDRSSGSELSNQGLGGIDLPDNIQKWLLVVLVICLIGIIVWGKGTYEDRLREKEKQIAELAKKDCAEELEVYIKLIHRLQQAQTTQIENVQGGLEKSKEITDQYEQVDTNVNKLIK
jgi:hypothetical protein|nr:MAG TPA: hypothetical protein [Bacteriophage sp.]DAM52909.1 MAG TPA: hypothetical protein [Caudoviricetes sp.]DAQ95935.1 MAG TPA: hypothetical protein [Caudoviricetes sp.]